MATIALSVVKVRAIGGRVYVQWSDNVETEFTSLQGAKDYVADLVQDKEWLRKLAIARYLFVDPTGANPSLIEGKMITVTNESNNMAVVSNG